MLRLALINSSRKEATVYAEAVARLRDTMFTAAVHAEEATLRDAATALSVNLTAASLDELLAAHGKEFDGVLIHGPVAQRAELAGRAALAGKQVFIAAPAANSITDLEQAEAACRSAGVTLMVGSPLRFRPSIAAVKSALDSGKLGVPALLRSHGWEPRDAGSVDQIWSHAVEQLDLAVWMFQTLPTEIYASGRNGPQDNRQWPDDLQIHLGFPNGGMALISLSQSLPAGESYDALTLIGSTGAAYADAHHQMHLLFRGETPQAVKSSEDTLTATAQLREFVQAVTEKRPPSSTADDGKTALQLAEAVWKSFTDGQPVRLEGGNYVTGN